MLWLTEGCCGAISKSGLDLSLAETRFVARLSPTLIGLTMAVSIASSAHATVLFDNTSTTATGGDSISALGPLFASFSTGAQPSDLSSLVLLLSASNSADGGSVHVQVLTDSGTNPSSPVGTVGYILDSAITSGSLTSPTAITLSASSALPLLPNSRYWIALSAGSSGTSASWSSDSGDTGATTANEYTTNFATIMAQGSPTQNLFNGGYLMTVNSQPVPEPASLYLVVFALAGLAIARQTTKHV